MLFQVLWIFLIVPWLVCQSPWSTGVAEAAPYHLHLRVKRYDTSLLTAHCGSLRNRCRHIPPGRCVRACVNGHIKTVCRIPPTHHHDRRCLVLDGNQ